ncbi:hypothetical protein ACFLVK_01525 [Chloroflexota bacterium]
MYEENSTFKKPENEMVKIWRYMDFTKYVSILNKSALFFVRANKMNDPFEGSLPQANIRARSNIHEQPLKDILENVSEMAKDSMQYTLINSWHMNEYESAAMWKLYLKSNDGIAVQSTFTRLKDSIQDKDYSVHIGKVEYIDYNTETIPQGIPFFNPKYLPSFNFFSPTLHKRKSYEHEQELRAITLVLPTPAPHALADHEDGKYIKTDLHTLIERVYLAPTCQDWLLDLVKSITKQYRLNKEVLRSHLDDIPSF